MFGVELDISYILDWSHLKQSSSQPELHSYIDSWIT
jgi:hypothetical protein